MTIDEAIKLLLEEIKHPYSAKKMGRPDALKLSVEALKRCRDNSQTFGYLPLLGETEVEKAVSAFPQCLPSIERWGENKEPLTTSSIHDFGGDIC